MANARARGGSDGGQMLLLPRARAVQCIRRDDRQPLDPGKSRIKAGGIVEIDADGVAPAMSSVWGLRLPARRSVAPRAASSASTRRPNAPPAPVTRIGEVPWSVIGGSGLDWIAGLS